MAIKKTAKKRASGTIKFTTRPIPFPDGKGGHFGVVVPNGTIGIDGLIDHMLKKGTVPEKMGRAEMRFVLDVILRTAAEEMVEKCCAVDLGFCKLMPVIRGHFESEDATFDRKRHELVVAAIPSPELKRALANGLKAVNVTPVDVPPPRIDSVCQSPDYVRNAISAAGPFEIHGIGLTTGFGGESAELELPSGVRVRVALKRQTKADGSRRVKAEFAESLPSPLPRRAWLVLRTHGLGGAGSPLQTVKSAALKLTP